jgi:ribosome biogenesis GTPase
MTDPETIERLRRIGWRGDALPAAGLRLARVVAQHRAGYELHDGESLFGAQPDGRFLKRGLDPAGRPVVGDFVEVAAGKPPHIVNVLARRTVLSRAAAGSASPRQPMLRRRSIVSASLMGKFGRLGSVIMPCLKIARR